MSDLSSVATSSNVEKGIGHSDSAGNTNSRFRPTSDDDACFKLWNMYIGQAQDYDRALLEGWKSDMDGMILFSALYSAVLATLIAESYQTLQEDPASKTVTLLIQMSQQLASISNGTTSRFQEPPLFTPTASSLVCNMLWFLSLALALSCSLLATFVQQWTRDFLHKATMRPSPVVQARVLAFSYFGLRRFGMHTFVDVIPILLHISLFLFFAGLVAFLLPINLPLTYLMACLMFVLTLGYLVLSCIPLFCLDAPYRTPVSDVIWRIGNKMHDIILRQHRLPSGLSLTEAMLEKSLRNPSARDHQIMKYTMRSLNHDTELFPMLEAIPEAILSPEGGVRLENSSLLLPLIQSSDPEENIVSRISKVISASGTSADPKRQKKDMMTALKALWCLARLHIQRFIQLPHSSTDGTPVFWFDHSLLSVLNNSDFAPKDYLLSTLALVRTSRLQSIKFCIDKVADLLSSQSISSCERLRMGKTVFADVSVGDIHWDSATFKRHFDTLDDLFDGYASGMSEYHAGELVKEAKHHVLALQNVSRWKAALTSILGEFLSKSQTAKLTPFEMESTYNLICSSIPGVKVSDLSVQVDEDEVEASHVLHDTSVDSDSVPPELFILIFQLASSTHQGLSCSKCRANVQEYICDASRSQVSYLLNQDESGYLEQCILRDLREGKGEEPSYCITAIEDIYIGLGSKTNHISPRLRTFVKEIFELVPKVSAPFTQVRWWTFTKAYTEWVLCKDILHKLDDLKESRDRISDDNGPASLSPQTMDDIHALGQRLLPDFAVPESPSPGTVDERNEWIEQLQVFMMSLTLSIVAKLTVICAEDNDVTVGDWIGMQHRMVNYRNGRIYEPVQLRFAESVRDFMSLQPWNQPKDSSLYDIFDSICRLSAHWTWITDLKSAQILAEAIRRHKAHKNFRGFIWMEQALFDRCTEVISRSESAL
ncbi:hypothetical protein K435DRAFT_854490 [Dendrothele bispora CBS 962.96]|uniref:DUF6535 domain-containing protein n=1 Tax=Dendrothele bispora (strain CBS 962.96) TaxID=1314807 RepID=A0A4S8MEC0_DENBC|nr:hypothetical protein K435DRAFT_854490 [Dendrothele bispora CBS 962.96]